MKIEKNKGLLVALMVLVIGVVSISGCSSNSNDKNYNNSDGTYSNNDENYSNNDEGNNNPRSNYWAKTYGDENFSDPWGVAIAPNNDVVVAGYTEKSGAGDGDAWVLRFDKNGKIKWQKTYGGNHWDGVYAVAPAPNGDMIAAGWTDSFGTWNHLGWILRIDQDGNVKWQKWYGRQEAEDYAVDDLEAVAVAPDGDIIAVGYTMALSKGGTGDVWVARLTSDGNVKWQKIYGGKNDSDAHAVAVAPNGDIIVAGETASFGAGDHDFWVLRLGSNGDIKWQKAYGGGDIDEANCVAIAPDGGIVVGGSSESFKEGGFDDALILKLDENGGIEWAKDFGAEAIDNDAFSLALTGNGDILVTANYLLLLSSDGKLKWAKRGYWNFANDPSVIAGTDVRVTTDGKAALVAPGTDGLLVSMFDIDSVSRFSSKEGWHSANIEANDVQPEVTTTNSQVVDGRAKVGATNCKINNTNVTLKTR